MQPWPRTDRAGCERAVPPLRRRAHRAPSWRRSVCPVHSGQSTRQAAHQMCYSHVCSDAGHATHNNESYAAAAITHAPPRRGHRKSSGARQTGQLRLRICERCCWGRGRQRWRHFRTHRCHGVRPWDSARGSAALDCARERRGAAGHSESDSVHQMRGRALQPGGGACTVHSVPARHVRRPGPNGRALHGAVCGWAFWAWRLCHGEVHGGVPSWPLRRGRRAPILLLRAMRCGHVCHPQTQQLRAVPRRALVRRRRGLVL